MMKKIIIILICVVLAVAIIGSFGTSNNDTDTDTEIVTDKVEVSAEDDSNIGKYVLEIDSCRLAEDYEGKSVAIVKYIFTNNDDNPVSFMVAFDDAVYQNGIGLNNSYFLADSANYSVDNQSKEIRTGATIEVEVAYELNDSTSDLEVEVGELFSFSDKKITKIFTIA
ncbi:MAG: DUF5067 domain-containing protein [Clostridia bacterium]|nr:DUF5067 domain-containing protein [Clostridia bacterium]